jgi:UDP-glucose 4-epimerase
MKYKNFLVTGGAGFIGSHLVEKLTEDKKNKIFVIDNLSNGKKSNLQKVYKKIKFINCDLSDTKKMEKISFLMKKIDCIIHLAALADIVPSIDNPRKYFDSNVIGTLNILEISKKLNVKKLIYIASASCYGIPKNYPTNENANIDTQYPYALTKYIGELMVQHWGSVYNINYTSLRLFNVYGPRSRTSGSYGAVMGVFLAQKLKNKPFTIVGDGKQTRDFTFVSDVVDAILLIIKKSKSKNKIFNVGSEKSVSVNYITNFLKGPKINIPKRPGEPKKTFADINYIKKELGWKPKIKIDEGLKILLDNIDEWRSAPIWTKSKIKKATNSWFKFLK